MDTVFNSRKSTAPTTNQPGMGRLQSKHCQHKHGAQALGFGIGLPVVVQGHQSDFRMVVDNISSGRSG